MLPTVSRTCLLILTVALAALAAAPAGPAMAEVILAQSTFDADLDGWTVQGGYGLSHELAGGNPGGFALAAAPPPDGNNYSGQFFAPAKFLGDLTALDGNGAIRWDHRVIEIGSSPVDFAPLQVALFSGGAAAAFAGPASSADDWVSAEALFDEALWTVSGAAWADILADVTAIRIRGEVVNNAGSFEDAVGLDNVFLVAFEQSSPVATPEPSMLAGLTFAFVWLALARARRDRRTG
jgi:hypothetical protein